MEKKKSLSQLVVWMGISLMFVLLLFLGCQKAGSLIVSSMWGVLGLIGVYLGVDLGAIVKKTKSISDGSFCVAESWKYLRMILALVVLIGVLLIQYYVYEINTVATLQIAVPGFFTLSAIYVGGMKLNKAVTGVKKGDT